MKEWDIFTSEPSVDNYLLVTALEDSPKTKEWNHGYGKTLKDMK